MIEKRIKNTLQSLVCLLRKNKIAIIITLISVFLGAIFGIIFSSNDASYIKILSSYDENFMNYIAGTADIAVIFWKRLLVILFGLSIIFVCNLNYYTSFISVLYITYQSSIFWLGIISTFSYYGFINIVLSVVFMFPINLMLFVILIISHIVFYDRAKSAHNYKINFSKSFGDFYFQNLAVICALCLLIEIVANIILPAILRGVFVINY